MRTKSRTWSTHCPTFKVAKLLEPIWKANPFFRVITKIVFTKDVVGGVWIPQDATVDAGKEYIDYFCNKILIIQLCQPIFYFWVIKLFNPSYIGKFSRMWTMGGGLLLTTMGGCKKIWTKHFFYRQCRAFSIPLKNILRTYPSKIF